VPYHYTSHSNKKPSTTHHGMDSLFSLSNTTRLPAPLVKAVFTTTKVTAQDDPSATAVLLGSTPFADYLTSTAPSPLPPALLELGEWDGTLDGMIKDPAGPPSTEEDPLPLTIAIIVIGILFAFLTAGGNLMVMVSIRVDRQLQTISNYFLYSLAVADFTIGVISIPLMTYYTANGYWGIGYAACQFWLCIDYLMSNASVLNLLLISLDRYFRWVEGGWLEGFGACWGGSGKGWGLWTYLFSPYTG
jgi:7 transmembrane receptor (rhodopsin family)